MMLPRRPLRRAWKTKHEVMTLLEGDRPPLRHYAGLVEVIKPAIACPSANGCRFFVPLL
jgi:hypothetical protein